ncbi:copper transporter ctr4 [Colletotrichum higginsianum]|uniref:Copper transport protein n=2 Tax=Colletotrichum higginsianum TaxID=80884 RepID=H1VDW2_COLHI|nr:Copper transporter ctr4 [Colletotrichum higginsianum IMI 349063]OBR09851.1 Copper transporter ctr4 [Colletotrichum higginsianum IMI 349063]TID07685.1 Copper transport protein ctr4 [Colletotrichum higginsianum]CCF38415.1 copper transporter ctr4 [Colletotrichum higginsianum]
MDHGSMNMATTTAAMAATGTMSMPAATSSKAAMSMGGSGCKISMLWNYNTIGSCFISSSWKITSNGMFAGSLIGVILLVILLEALRRAVKEYDRYLIRTHKARYADAGAASPSSASADDHAKGPSSSAAAVRSNVVPPFRPNVFQQAVRALIHVCQFAVAYFVMLLAMYYNGYMIICIFIGSYIGAFLFQWETLFDEPTSAAREATVCCG